MNYRLARFFVLTLIILVASQQAFGASFVIPSDREMILRSKAIVVATAVSSYAVRSPDGLINTVFEFNVEQVLKGAIDASATLRLVEGGGALGGRYELVPEAPVYAIGERALIFIRSGNRGENSTYGMTLGKFNFVDDLHGLRLVLRGASEGEIFGWDADGSRHVEPLRSAEGFLRYIGEVVIGAERAETYIVDTHAVAWPKPKSSKANSQGFHACDYLIHAGGFCGFRWEGIFDFPSGSGFKVWETVGTEAGIADPLGGVDHAMAAWNGDPLSNVNYARGGATSRAFSIDDNVPTIHLDDTADIAAAGCDPSVAIACTRFGGGSTHTFDGGSMISMSDADIAVKAGWTTSQTRYDEALTHELGHSLGFRHAEAAAPSSTSAIMYFNVTGNFGAALQQWDKDAVQTVYNPSPAGVCVAPVLGVAASATPPTITAGNSSQLSVGTPSSGTAPFTFVWSTAGQPVGTNQQINVSPTVTTTYTVTITNSCGNITSNATVTVNPACTSPTISANPQSQTSNTPGQQVTLSVGATGGTQPYSYQWFTGSPGFGTPISGQTSATLSVSPTVTTNYYATVTSACGGTAATSAAATITVGTVCVPPQITLQPVSQSISSGSTASLSMGYSGSSGTVTWYQGLPTNRATPLSANQIFTTPPLTANTNYWAEIVNGCGNAQTVGVTITVISGPVCTAPTITLQPASQSISTGGTASLSMGYSGTSGTVTWYQGTPPIKTTPVGSTQNFTTLALTTNTSFWAEVVNNCGNAQTIAAVITVTPANTCSNAAIVSHPVSGSIIVGGVATLSVSASGSSPLSYQWYQGAKGDTSKPVGTNSASFTSSPISANTSFWVRVTNTCNGTQTADSNAASITVTVSRHRGVRH